jgi:hypothetical protein
MTVAVDVKSRLVLDRRLHPIGHVTHPICGAISEIKGSPRIAADHGIILLDDAVAEIDGVRFIGSTLWSDFMLRPPYIMFGDAVRSAGRMNDYRLIKTGRGRC